MNIVGERMGMECNYYEKRFDDVLIQCSLSISLEHET
jgi:hypothetical protein